MASSAVFLSGLVVLMSLFFPFKKGNSSLEDTETRTITGRKTETSVKAKVARSLALLSLQDNSQADSIEQLSHENIGNLLKDYIAQDLLKRQYRRKVENDKAAVSSSQKVSADSPKTTSQYDHLVTMLFGQKFKVKTNASLTALNKTGIAYSDQVKQAHKDRVDKILSILAIFGKQLETDSTVAHTSIDTPSETVTLTTQSPRVNINRTSCLHVEGYDDHQWIHLVNFCSEDWTNQTVLYLCKNAFINDYVMTDTPVQDAQGTVYANRFCAFCNHVHVGKMRKWKIAWTCERNHNPAASLMEAGRFGDLMDIVTSLRIENTCKMIRTPAFPQTVQSCPSPVLRGSQYLPMVNGQDHVPLGSGYPVSLNILMNFDFSGKTHIMFEDLYAEESIETKLCPQDNFVWDREKGRCREVVCAKGYHFDDTYTTCLMDDNSITIKEEEVITDLSQLAQSNDIERVTLEVEVPSGFAALVTITTNDFWKEQIASQLNITITRIQQFNITVENATGEVSTLVIQKLSKEDFSEDSEENGLSEGASNNETTSSENLAAGTLTEVRLNEADQYGIPSPNEGSVAGYFQTIIDHLGGNDPNVGLYKNVEGHGMNKDVTADAPDAEKSMNIVYSTLRTAKLQKLDSPAEPNPAPNAGREDDAGDQQNFKVIMSFILLPPESFRSDEQRSGPVVAELSSLVSRGELKFIINGTSLKVENMAKEDNVGVFSPACPHGLLLVLDGEQIELSSCCGNYELGSNITTLKDLRTGKIYVQGMFDVSFIVTQPIENTSQKANFHCEAQ